MVTVTMLLLFFIRPSAERHMHNSCWTCAHQLMCKRTTAVGRLIESISWKT